VLSYEANTSPAAGGIIFSSPFLQDRKEWWEYLLYHFVDVDHVMKNMWVICFRFTIVFLAPHIQIPEVKHIFTQSADQSPREFG
jgi:hypothetical protein